jgi:hypothetical protein
VLHHAGEILLRQCGMARCAEHFDAGGNLAAIFVVAPQIPLVHPPKVYDFSVGEQGDVDRMVQTMIDKDVGHVLRGDPNFFE